jgi:hypothetical protein
MISRAYFDHALYGCDGLGTSTLPQFVQLSNILRIERRRVLRITRGIPKLMGPRWNPLCARRLPLDPSPELPARAA